MSLARLSNRSVSIPISTTLTARTSHTTSPSRRSNSQSHGLHLTQPGSELWRERLTFRDALRNAPTLAAEYETLKLRLAHEHRHDAHAYTMHKRAFVARVLASAGIPLGRP